ncbi:MAG: transporter ATP-binding protein [Rhizobacter sp.]|nr:transporter ATP-binding protein [Rhizobacter sp.]
MRLLITALLHGVTLAALYFLVASGFSLIFGLLRQVNLAHGSVFLLGAYTGFSAAERFDSWLLGLAAGTVASALLGWLMYVALFRRLRGQELRQTLASIALSIILADAMMWIWGGQPYQLDLPRMLSGSTELIAGFKYPTARLFVLAVTVLVGVGLYLLLSRTRFGIMVRAGVDDAEMLATTGVRVNRLFMATFALGAALTGFAGVIGASVLSVSPGEDARYLLASLVVVIVGGIGSLKGAAVGALLIGLAEQLSLVYTPTYGVVFTFLLMAVVLRLRPHGLYGRAGSLRHV